MSTKQRSPWKYWGYKAAPEHAKAHGWSSVFSSILFPDHQHHDEDQNTIILMFISALYMNIVTQYIHINQNLLHKEYLSARWGKNMCILFRVAENGRLSWQPTKGKCNSEIQDAMIGLSKIIQIAQKF